MTDLATVLINECSAMTHEEALAHVKAKTVMVDGMAQSGSVLAYIASINKLADFRSIAADSASPLRDAADAAIVTLETREGFDFSSPGTLGLMAAFVSAGVLTQVESDAIRAIGQREVSEFPDANIFDVVTVRSPADVGGSSAEFQVDNNANRNQRLSLTLNAAAPVESYVNILVSHSPDNIDWTPFKRIHGFYKIKDSGLYIERLPGEFIHKHTRFKVECVYSLDMTLAVEAA